MPYRWDPGWSGAVLSVCLVLFQALALLVRRKWRLAEARRAEVMRLVKLAAAETERAEKEAAAALTFTAEPPFKAVVGDGPAMLHCAVCHSPTATRCARCKVVKYCSGKCQIIHWRNGHKDVCHPPPLVEHLKSRPYVPDLRGGPAERTEVTDNGLANEGYRNTTGDQCNTHQSVCVMKEGHHGESRSGDSRSDIKGKPDGANAIETLPNVIAQSVSGLYSEAHSEIGNIVQKPSANTYGKGAFSASLIGSLPSNCSTLSCPAETSGDAAFNENFIGGESGQHVNANPYYVSSDDPTFSGPTGTSGDAAFNGNLTRGESGQHVNADPSYVSLDGLEKSFLSGSMKSSRNLIVGTGTKISFDNASSGYLKQQPVRTDGEADSNFVVLSNISFSNSRLVDAQNSTESKLVGLNSKICNKFEISKALESDNKCLEETLDLTAFKTVRSGDCANNRTSGNSHHRQLDAKLNLEVSVNLSTAKCFSSTSTSVRLEPRDTKSLGFESSSLTANMNKNNELLKSPSPSSDEDHSSSLAQGLNSLQNGSQKAEKVPLVPVNSVKISISILNGKVHVQDGVKKMTSSASTKHGQSGICSYGSGKYDSKMLFPYELFIKLYNSDKVELNPCGLINCGNRYCVSEVSYMNPADLLSLILRLLLKCVGARLCMTNFRLFRTITLRTSFLVPLEFSLLGANGFTPSSYVVMALSKGIKFDWWHSGIGRCMGLIMRKYLLMWPKCDYPHCYGHCHLESCYANAALQCLASTRPLAAYLLEGLHAKSCPKIEWCFTCAFERLLMKAKQGQFPLSPSGIISHIHDIGSNFSQGREEDAHEFLRHAIDAMQSACLKEAAASADSELAQETTLIQLIFGGYLHSKIKCMRCKGKSERRERMMDLTVEMHGDIETLEEALARFTANEILEGENKYKCDRCKSYEQAKKQLTILEAPNVLTIALKRYQSGKFGKLNKMVRFPEYLNLAPYMRGPDDKSPVYRLYAVVVHQDVMNAAFSGHYVCYVKNTLGKWFKADDSVVKQVDLQTVLSQGAYMLLYARCSPRAPRLLRKEIAKKSKLKQSGDTNDSKTRSSSMFSHTGLTVMHPEKKRASQTYSPTNFGPHDLFDERLRRSKLDISSDSSSLFSYSDEGSCWSADSTKDSATTEDFSESICSEPGHISCNIPLRFSEDSDGFSYSPNSSGQIWDSPNLSPVCSSLNTDDGRDFPGEENLPFLCSTKQYRNLTEHCSSRSETNSVSSSEVKSSVLLRSGRERTAQKFY